MYTVFIRTSERAEPFMETINNFMFDEKGNLRLYSGPYFWFFPYTVLQYVYIKEVENAKIEPDNSAGV